MKNCDTDTSVIPTTVNQNVLSYTNTIQNKICKKNEPTYYEFMNIRKSEKQAPFTHTHIIGRDGGSWFIDDNDLELFYKLYANEISKNNCMYITEKHQNDYGPIIIDFDFKYDQFYKKSPISINIINNIVNNITNFIKEAFDESEDFTCIVSARKSMYMDKNTNTYKDGIHIIFPYIVAPYKYHYILRKQYLKIMEEDIKDIQNCMGNISDKYKCLKTIYDKSVLEKNNWFLYMSTKPDTYPYVIVKLYSDTLTNAHIKKMSTIDLVKLMSIRNKKRLSVKSDNYDNILMSYYNLKNKKEFVKEVPVTNAAIVSSIHCVYDIAKDMVNILSQKRNDDFNYWIKIGFIFKHLQNSDNTLDYFDIWKMWSKQSDKYTEGCCEKYWDHMKICEKGLTIRSLYYYARKDNESLYRELINKINKDHLQVLQNKEDDIISILNDGHIAIADYYADLNRRNIIFTDNNIYLWDDKTKLWKLTDIDTICSEHGRYIRGILVKLRSKAIANNKTKKVTKITKIMNKCTSYNNIQSVIKLTKPLLKDEYFEAEIDSCRYVINFMNGIYNLKTGIFRERTKEDNITKCLQFNYNESVDNKIKEDIMNVLLRISNDDVDLLEFNLGWLGYCLTGETKEQKFLMMIGYSAGNGKSTMAKMFMHSLPIYSEKIDKKTFTIGYNNSHKQFARIKKPVRFVCIEEMDRTKLDTDLLKNFVDGDKHINEVLYKTTENIKLYCKIYCTSNKDPNFESDEGMKRRGLLVTLTNRFLDKREYDSLQDKTGVYLRDTKLDSKFEYNDDYKMAFISILIPYAKKYYDTDELYTTVDVKEGFINLCNDNDMMKTFIEDYIIITNNQEDKMHRDKFTEYYNAAYNTRYKWSSLMSDVKRYLTYNRQIRSDNKQGSIIGIKHIYDDEGKEKYNKAINNLDHL
jgi:phage/plasmid-associated DNA primase